MRVARMHGDTEGAAVDLRGTNLHEVAQLRIEPGLVDVGLQGSHGLIGGGTDLGDINARLHGKTSIADVAPAAEIARRTCRQSDRFVTIRRGWNGTCPRKVSCRRLGESRPLANPVWGRGGVGT